MGIEDVKRWQWSAIGLVAGAIFAFAQLQMYADEMMPHRRSIAPESLLGDLGRTATSRQLPVVRKLVIYPPEEGKNFVTGERLERLRDEPDKAAYQPFGLHAEIPFDVRGVTPANDAYTIRDHLAQLAAQNPTVRFKYAWWREPVKSYTLWMTLGVLVIGGIWPTMINLMIGAGLARQREPKFDYDLDRFKSEQAAENAKRKGMTAAELDQLRAIEAQLEERLQPSGSGHSAGASPQSPEPIKQLNSGPMETVNVAHQDEEEKDYKGEFYPVARPHGKKHE